MSKKLIGIFQLILFIVVMLLLWKWIGTPLLGFLSEPERFRAFVDQYGIVSRIVFIAMIVFQVIVAVIPGEPFEIAAGYAFGAVEGTILCLIGAAIGSGLVFLLVRKFGINLVRHFFREEQIEKIRFLQQNKKRYLLFAIIFAIPGTPKDLLSYFAGLTDMRFSIWLCICSIGRIPSVVTSTIGGNALGVNEHISALIIFAVTVFISLLGLTVYNYICNRSKQVNEKGNME